MQFEIIKLMPDYQCFPLWRIGNSTVENISPNELRISNELKDLITSWQLKYDSTLNLKNPNESGFQTLDEELLFDEEGYIIWNRLKQELNDEFEVNYFSIRDGKLHK